MSVSIGENQAPAKIKGGKGSHILGGQRQSHVRGARGVKNHSLIKETLFSSVPLSKSLVPFSDA